MSFLAKKGIATGWGRSPSMMGMGRPDSSVRFYVLTREERRTALSGSESSGGVVDTGDDPTLNSHYDYE